MSIKNKIMAGVTVIAGMFGGKAAAQEIGAEQEVTPGTVVEVLQDNTTPTETKDSVATWPNVAQPEVNKKADTWPQYSSPKKKPQKIAWENTPEGAEVISTYIHALEKIGEHPQITAEDYVYLRALANFNREVAMIDGTGYVMDKEDLQGIKPDSLQNKLAQDTQNWLTPAKYAGKNCNHAIKGNLFSNGLLLDTQGVSPACDMEKYYRDDINFVGAEIDPKNDCYAAHGTTKIYRKTKAHPYGHIGMAIEAEGSETTRDSSDKLRNNINENNYSGVICYFTAHSEASLETCIAAWGTKYKKEHRPMVIDEDAPMNTFSVDLTPKQVFETAIACKENYFERYTAAMNNMPTNHTAKNGYIFGPPTKIPLLAHNAKRVAVKGKKTTRSGARRR
ncbi:MAG: hypothetical protein J6Y91_05355 [Alphaproteobacteria bacterium]|nr:hypothetical protein [Alphaproteobacteria bacterium]